jgi:protein-tyrosine-phosphatase
VEKGIILFVCTGNTCRSVMAQALFQKLKDKFAPDLNYQADSAGIRAIEGLPPTEETIICMSKQGLDISAHKAKSIDNKIIKKSSLILTMTQQQRIFLKKQFPLSMNKIFLFKTFCLRNKCIKNPDIEDPYGKDMFFYEKICSQLEQDINKLINRLREE